ncbi:MAG: hypothetical protein M9962_02075 [Oligoflexia bacterium]|nr:hypothetical protein [Oligoflexia bacterium]
MLFFAPALASILTLSLFFLWKKKNNKNEIEKEKKETFRFLNSFAWIIFLIAGIYLNLFNFLVFKKSIFALSGFEQKFIFFATALFPFILICILVWGVKKSFTKWIGH